MNLSLEPFVGDRRQTLQPTARPAGSDPKPVLRGSALRLIRSFVKYGVFNDDATGGLLWVLVTWCEHHGVAYRLDGKWGHGYSITKIEEQHEHFRRRA